MFIENYCVQQFHTLCQSYLVDTDVRMSRGKPKWSSLTKVLSEFMLRYIKGNQLAAKFVAFLSLQWSYILLHHH